MSNGLKFLTHVESKISQFEIVVKDVRAKIFQSMDFFSNFYCSQIMSYLYQKCKKIWGYRLRFSDKAGEKLP